MTENEVKKHLKLCKESRLFIPKKDVLDTAIQALEEIQQYRAIGTVEELIKEHKELIELSRRYLIDTNELLEYQAIGTVEELQKLKLLFGNENVEISELTTKILKEYPEYLSIGTIEEFKALKEKSVAKKIEFMHNRSDTVSVWKCHCGNVFLTKHKEGILDGTDVNYCCKCGQKIDWSEEE